MSEDLFVKPVQSAKFTEAFKLSEEEVNANKAPEKPSETERQEEGVANIAEKRIRFVEALSRSQNISNSKLVIEKDPDSGRFVHKILDPETGSILMQWPEDEWLELIQDLEDATGAILDILV